ncbi:penicillin-binding transpeptidase domain-containing protein [Anaerolentibacter hominis]|uniref:penicillin-binding transpeptidase domain-containing protein n=1 Tax=Anaerolentibacter hominis TaxID=3079009 RepID=UPI0031B8143F
MFDVFLEHLKKILKSRFVPICIIYTVLFFLLIHGLFQIQIVDKDTLASSEDAIDERTREIKSTRGNFYDRNGKLLAYNELCYSVTIEDNGSLTTSQEKNTMIATLIGILEKYDCKPATEFYIAMDENGQFYFTAEGSTLLRFRKDAYSTENLSEEQQNSTAEEIFRFLRYDTGVDSPKFNISEEYTDEEALEIMSVRFALYVNRYRYMKDYMPITVASDVSDQVVVAIKESSADLPGVEVVEETRRVYNYSEYFAHILGYTGLISQETLAETMEAGDDFYSSTDQIGKTGLEKEFESYLRGEKGHKTVKVNNRQQVVEESEFVEATAGNDVYLTIDADLQEACYKLLERRIAGILLDKIHPGTSEGTKGERAGGILIPIYEVYFALIDNNVIDVTQFNNKKASSLEKSIYNRYLDKQKSVLSNIRQKMGLNSTAAGNELSNSMQEYLSHIYELLLEQGVLIQDKIDEEDSKYIQYTKDKLSLSAFLQHALANTWIDLSVLEIDDSYYSTDELYGMLLDYIEELLKKDSRFTKMIYSDMVYSYELSGKEVCLLLYEQGVLKKDKDTIAKLESGAMSPYSFIINKIKKLEITPDQLALDPCSGAIVVNDVNTGQVLAMVTYPSYDNNKMANTIDSEYYTYLVNNNSKPFLNRATQTQLAPGSTYKMLTSAAALEEGVAQEGTRVKDQVVFNKIPMPPKCWISPSSHGTIDITTALEVSCNYFFYEMGWQMSQKSGVYNSDVGLRKLRKYAKLFGLDSTTGVEIGEAEPKISTQDSIRSAIGQGNNAYTPVQLCRYVSTVANSGTCYDMTLIDSIRDLNGNVIMKKEPVVSSEADFSPTTWRLIHNGMWKVCNGSRSSVSGLFKSLLDGGVAVAGKTGTAQQNTFHPDHAQFVSYAPYDNPEIAVQVTIPNGYSSTNAAELVSYVYQYYYKVGDTKKLINGDATKPKSSARSD